MKTNKGVYLVLALAVATGFWATSLAETVKQPLSSTHVADEDLEWLPIVREDIPPGMELKRLHINPLSKGGISKLRFPAGYIEPKHYHTTSGHSIYIVSGRVNYMGDIATEGDYIYTPTNVVHGVIVLEAAEILIWSDGIMDFNLIDQEKEFKKDKQ